MNEHLPDLKIRTKQFAPRVIGIYSQLPKGNAVAKALGKQVLRSGTSVGANYSKDLCEGTALDAGNSGGHFLDTGTLQKGF